MVLKEPQDLRVFKEDKELQDHKEPQDLRVLLDPMELKELKVFKEDKELQVLKEFKVFWEAQVQQNIELHLQIMF
jgi:hypothetical protein